MHTSKLNPLFAALLALAPGFAAAAPITALEDGFTILGSPDSVSAIDATDSGYGGPDNLIDGDLSTGFPNMSNGNILTFGFSGGLTNNAGADLLVVDGRYDSADVGITVAGTSLTFAADDFIDTGVTDALSASFGTFTYTAFALLVDLSDFGVLDGASVTSFDLETLGADGFDPIDVAAIRMGDTMAPIPLPAGAPLLLAGLGAFGLLRRSRKSR